jgi:hypothetical protein
MIDAQSKSSSHASIFFLDEQQKSSLTAHSLLIVKTVGWDPVHQASSLGNYLLTTVAKES